MTRNSPSDIDVDALLKELDAPPRVPSAEGLWADDFRPLLQAWIADVGITQGLFSSITPYDMYRHFVGWCLVREYDLPVVTAGAFGRAMWAVGVFRSYRSNGSRVYMLNRDGARFFRQWLKANPRPPGEMAPGWANLRERITPNGRKTRRSVPPSPAPSGPKTDTD